MDNICVLWNIHRCTLCSYRTKFFSNIQNHLKDHESRPKVHQFICYIHAPEKYHCEECQFQSNHKVLITSHFNTIHKTEETQHRLNPLLQKCENCDFQTYSSLVFLSHHYRCDGAGNLNFQTSQTENYSQLENKKVRRFQCAHRPYKAIHNYDLERHMLHKHTPSEQINWFKCGQCGYKSTHKGYLRYHILQKHTPPHEIKWFECKQCMYQSKMKRRLREHVISQHSQPQELEKRKRFKCDLCSYKATMPRYLRGHMLRKHTPSEQINWFKCDLCSYKSKDARGLHRHELVWHNELWKV